MSDISSHWLTYFMMICKTRSGVSADCVVFSYRPRVVVGLFLFCPMSLSSAPQTGDASEV
jgi:hypothetical protein